MKHSAKRMISVDEISAKEQQARASAQELIKETKSQRHMAPTQEFLRHIHSFVVKLHEYGVSYARISRWIEETYSYKVSAQSVRKYIQSASKQKGSAMIHPDRHIKNIQGVQHD